MARCPLGLIAYTLESGTSFATPESPPSLHFRQVVHVVDQPEKPNFCWGFSGSSVALWGALFKVAEICPLPLIQQALIQPQAKFLTSRGIYFADAV